MATWADQVHNKADNIVMAGNILKQSASLAEWYQEIYGALPAVDPASDLAEIQTRLADIVAFVFSIYQDTVNDIKSSYPDPAGGLS